MKIHGLPETTSFLLLTLDMMAFVTLCRSQDSYDVDTTRTVCDIIKHVTQQHKTMRLLTLVHQRLAAGCDLWSDEINIDPVTAHVNSWCRSNTTDIVSSFTKVQCVIAWTDKEEKQRAGNKDGKQTRVNSIFVCGVSTFLRRVGNKYGKQTLMNSIFVVWGIIISHTFSDVKNKTSILFSY